MEHLKQNKDWTPKQRPEYMKKLTRCQASNIFKARTRMIDTKNNFRGKYNDLVCRACKLEVETQDHILEKCQTIHTADVTKVTTIDVFDDDVPNLRNTANKITDIMHKLDNA